MKVNWTTLGITLAQLVPIVVGKVQKTKADAPGPEKKADVLDLARTLVAGTEVIAGKDLIDDNAVQSALSGYIDATVALKNAIASAHQSASGVGGGSTAVPGQ